MDNPRADKVEVVDEVRERLEGAQASVVTEYRGLTVAAMAELRRNLRAVGGDYKVFKNTLVKLAVAGGDHEGISEHLTGPTAITFIEGDVSAVAKALRDFAKDNPELIIKGGVLDGKALSASDLKALASLPSREVLLAQLAGLIASPMQSLAGLFKAVPQSFAYGLRALIDSKPAEEAPAAEAPAADAAPVDEAPALTADETTEAAPVDEVAAVDEAPAEEPAADEAPAGDSTDD
jgi:large subunit ribosomal protein L10